MGSQQDRLSRADTWLEGHRGELAVADLDVAAFVLFHLVEAVSHAAVLGRDHTPGPAEVEDELTGMILRYLTG